MVWGVITFENKAVLPIYEPKIAFYGPIFDSKLTHIEPKEVEVTVTSPVLKNEPNWSVLEPKIDDSEQKLPIPAVVPMTPPVSEPKPTFVPIFVVQTPTAETPKQVAVTPPSLVLTPNGMYELPVLGGNCANVVFEVTVKDAVGPHDITLTSLLTGYTETKASPARFIYKPTVTNTVETITFTSGDLKLEQKIIVTDSLYERAIKRVESHTHAEAIAWLSLEGHQESDFDVTTGKCK